MCLPRDSGISRVLAQDQYVALAEGNRIRDLVLPAPRGRLLDRHGQVLVNNRPSWVVTVNSAEMGKHKQATLGRLARTLKLGRAELDERLTRYNGSPFRGAPVAEDVPASVLLYLAEHQDDFPGVSVAVVPLRNYPNGELAAHVLGYVGEISQQQLERSRRVKYRPGDVVGKAGIEQTYDNLLRGQDGVQRIEVNAAGRMIRTLQTVEPRPGKDLRLTIDLGLQRATEQALAQGMRMARTIYDKDRRHNYPAPAGAAIVLDPRDGSLLALASLPQYDPRRFANGISRKEYGAYANDPTNPLLNRAVQSAYPPGSTWKPITALAALRAGLITPRSTVPDPGYYKFGGRRFRGAVATGLGLVDLRASLVKSSDVYYYHVGAAFAAQEQAQERTNMKASEKIQATGRAFGFGRAPAVDLPFSAAGVVPDRAWRKRYWEDNRDLYCAGKSALYRHLCKYGDVWQGGDDLNLAIGQGDLQVSPLQLASAYGALANGGKLYAPHVAKELERASTGKRLRPVKPRLAKTGISRTLIRPVNAALTEVPTEGTAAAAFADFPLNRFPIAAKTGTAELPPKSPFAWFASFGPANDPRYVVVVMVEEGGFGGQTSAPIARAIYERLFGLPRTAIHQSSDRSR